jgi:hypothetical protein
MYSEYAEKGNFRIWDPDGVITLFETCGLECIAERSKTDGKMCLIRGIYKNSFLEGGKDIIATWEWLTGRISVFPRVDWVNGEHIGGLYITGNKTGLYMNEPGDLKEVIGTVSASIRELIKTEHIEQTEKLLSALD